MANDVTSWFTSEANKKFHNPDTVPIVRKFLIATSDYSVFVTKWPRFRNTWDEVKPSPLTIKLANEEQTFNFLREAPVLMKSLCKVQIGMTHPTSGDELIDLHEGEITQLRYIGGTCSVTISDKFKVLTEKVIGDNDIPVDYTASDHLLSDIAWYICTSHAGLSAIESSSNPDIDYDLFAAWALTFSRDTVLINAYFDGIKCNQALRKIARMSQSAIYKSDTRIAFARWTSINSNISSLDNTNVMAASIRLSDTDIINKQIISGAYDVNSETYGFTVSEVLSSSVNSFGLRVQIDEDATVWYTNSISALNLAQRVMSVSSEPRDKISVTTGMAAITRQIGETMHFVSSLENIVGVFRIMKQEIDMDKGMVRAEIDKTQVFGGFTLDDSVDGLLDQSYNLLL